jgi:hypothetical protein
VTLENVRYRLPAGTIGESAVDQNDSLYGRVRAASKTLVLGVTAL